MDIKRNEKEHIANQPVNEIEQLIEIDKLCKLYHVELINKLEKYINK